MPALGATMSPQTIVGLLSILGLSAGCTTPADGQFGRPVDGSQREVSFEFIRNQIVVQTRIRGRGPYSCLIDSGANPSAVDITLAQELNLPIGDRGGPAEGVGTQEVLVYPTDLDVAIEGTLASRIPAVAVDLSSLSKAFDRPIDCVLGQSWLTSRVVQIDYPSHRLRFSAKNVDPPPSSFRCDEFAMRFWLPDDWMPLVMVQVNGIDIPVSLDTGSSGTLKLFPDGALKAGVAPPSATDRGHVITGARGSTSVNMVMISSLKFGPLVAENVQGSVGDRNLGEPEGRLGNLGNGLLRHGVLTLDFPARRISVCAPRAAETSPTGCAQQSAPGDAPAPRERPQTSTLGRLKLPI